MRSRVWAITLAVATLVNAVIVRGFGYGLGAIGVYIVSIIIAKSILKDIEDTKNTKYIPKSNINTDNISINNSGIGSSTNKDKVEKNEIKESTNSIGIIPSNERIIIEGLDGPSYSKEMFCRKCGKKILPGASFCNNCGERAFDLSKGILDETSKSNKKEDKAHQRDTHILNKFSIITYVLLGVVLVSLVFNFIQLLNHKKLSDDNSKLESNVSKLKMDLKEKDNIIKAKEEKITEKDSVIDNLNTSVNRYKRNNDMYNDIIRSLDQDNIGYAANNFRVDQGVIIVKLRESKKIKLTAYWNNGGEVDIRRKGLDCAGIDFDKDSWNTSVNLTVTGYSIGTTSFTFTNSENNDYFNIIVVVIER